MRLGRIEGGGVKGNEDIKRQERRKCKIDNGRKSAREGKKKVKLSRKGINMKEGRT
jgi:hypothetical protein